MDIFVGSLPFKLKETELREIFEKYGEVVSATIVIDKITRQNKGFGFVEMAVDAQAYKAINELDGTEIDGRKIVVNKSEPKKEKSKKRRFNGGNDRGYNKEK
ncbi:MAG: RNA-binding protein [Bacteroidota bacterium]